MPLFEIVLELFGAIYKVRASIGFDLPSGSCHVLLSVRDSIGSGSGRFLYLLLYSLFGFLISGWWMASVMYGFQWHCCWWLPEYPGGYIIWLRLMR